MYTELLRLFFRREEFGPLRFPDELDSLYGTVVDGLIGTAPAIAHNQYRIDDETFESIGSQFCRYFPAHFFKAYAAQRDMESACFAEENDTRFLGWPATTLIDIGCGAGAVSLAHLALVLRFQQHLLENGSSISPIDVYLIGIDTNQYMLDLYKQMVERFSKMLTPYLIRVQFDIVKAAFPSNEISQIFRLPKPVQCHYALIGLSNIIRPLDEMYRRDETVWIEKISQALQDEPFTESSFGSAESRIIEKFMDEWQVDRLGILGIVTKSRSAQGIPWKQYLTEINGRIVKRLAKQHEITVNGIFDDRECMIANPKQSLWRTRNKKVEHRINFSWRHLEISNRSFVQDEQWHQLLAYSNLELAWARARNYALREALTDEVELRLFDVDTEFKLRRLRAFMLMKAWDRLNTRHLVQFDSPKSVSESRPKTIARLEEQILATALIQLYGHNAAREKSYSYRLKTDGGEFLYEYWLNAWKSFIADTHELAQDRSVLRADIREFYKHIEQDSLMTIASRTFQLTSKRTNELLGALIKRNCGTGHLPGFGLPQGHIASGYWADIFLSKLDKLIESEFPQNVAFARYADDMFFSYSGSINDIEQRLSNYAKVKLL
ncbi:MAG: reverse transcriptase domain-containing protein [Caldilinea sp.]|nr:reverse transcriptase domain-containing protein [Caldilinea sp.]